MNLWLTDRSRYSTGTGRCGRERYLTYHAGPTGYGLVRKGESLPLATGSYAHQAMEQLFAYMQRADALPPDAEVRVAIAVACAAYEKKIEAKGYRGLLQSERGDYVIAEQKSLITGLIWAVSRLVLPWIHEHYRIIEVETESIYVLDCSCGLGSGVLDGAAHAARHCRGIGLQLKQDCLAQRRLGGGLAYIESKTTGWAGDNWASQWETKPQLALGALGIKERYQKEITETFILGLYKGSRKLRGAGEDAIKQQDSPFCYGYLKPGNPPMATDDWKPAYEWVDEWGVTNYARRPFSKSPIWSGLANTDWPEYATRAPGQDPAEWWARWLPKSVIEKQVFLLGPMNVQTAQQASLRGQIVGEEQRWQGILWSLYEHEQQTGEGWGTESYMALLDRLVPASWDCRRFGAGSECQHTGICFRREGWQAPLERGWIPRRPHHDPELQGAIARGLLPEQSEEEGEEE